MEARKKGDFGRATKGKPRSSGRPALLLDKEGKLIEGSAAVAVAALLREPETYRNKTSVIVVCGGNVGSQKLQKIIELARQQQQQPSNFLPS
ncbi:putative threonine dehydratase [Diplonema papillatum]|nr:putative threonine dehydratase [Diplonema papillatum]